MTDDIAAALKIIFVLNSLDVPYLIGGSIASSIHGLSRSTNDADLLADFRKEHIRDFVEAVEKDFYVSSESILDAIKHQSSFNLVDYSTGFKIDIFIARARRFDRSQLEHRVEVAVSQTDTKVFVARAEDTVLAKLEWYKAGNEVSDRQWNDIINVIKMQAQKLDIGYMKEMARELSVFDLLERALEKGHL